jgi:Fur family ferric uptake transcriptional regulator
MAAPSKPPVPPCSADRPLSELTDHLRRRDRRVTGPRQAILETLRRHAGPLSTREILARLPEKHCDLATVYRSMHLLLRLGLVQRYDLGDGVARYELLAAGDDGHHHHLVCRRCARVLKVEDCALAAVEAELAQRSGFAHVSHHLEFFGICPACQEAGDGVK